MEEDYYCSELHSCNCPWVVVAQDVVDVVVVVAEAAEAVLAVEEDRGLGHGHIKSRVRLLPPSWGSWPAGKRHNGRG